jgi:hypothetical protein
MPQTAKSRRLQKARARYDRKRSTFDEKCATLTVIFNLTPVSLASRRWIGRRLEEMAEDYLRTEHRVEITKLEERNHIAAEKLIARQANKAARRAEGKLTRAEAKQAAKTLKNNPAPVVPVEDPSLIWKKMLEEQQQNANTNKQ